MKGSGADFNCPNFRQALKFPHGPGEADKGVEGAAVFKIFYRPEEDRLPFLQYRELICPSAQLFKAVGDKIGPSFGTRRSLSQ